MKFVVALVFVCLSANVLVSGLPQNPTEQAAESGSQYILFRKKKFRNFILWDENLSEQIQKIFCDMF